MNVEVIIVGQGIAGTAIAQQLLQKSISFIVIDRIEKSSASLVASGLINPITGRNFVKSWMVDDLIPEAITFYHGISNLIGQDIIGKHKIVRALHSVQEENQWYGRLGQEDYQKYILPEYDGPNYENYMSESFSYGEIKESFNIDSESLIVGFRKKLKELDLIIEEEFDYSHVQISDLIQYKHITAHRIIFAEGWKGASNPFFSHYPFRPAQGEVLICRIPDFPISHILKYHKFIVPLYDDIFWVGSTYQWNISDENERALKKKELVDFLETYLKCPYEILEYKSGIRPATKFRKPFVGTHPNHPNIHILNGLGTKGFSLAPYWSKYLVDHIYEGKQIHPELPKLQSL